VAEHAEGRPGAQQLHVVDAVATGDHGMHQGEQLAPWAGRPGRSPRSTSWSVARSISSRSAKVAGSSSPALATARWSSKAISTWSSTTWEDGIEKVSSGSGS
jgi:hypothetical protein